MKRFLYFLVCFAVFAACLIGGCTVAEKAGSIPDIEKCYIAGLENTVTVNLDEYVNSNGTSVYYTVKSSDEEIATVEIDGCTLTATLEGNEGSTVVTVTVEANGRKAFNLSFMLTVNVCERVACIGDSLTYGHSWHNESYPVYLQEYLGDGVEVRNFGVNGSAVTNRNESNYKLKYDTLTEYSDSLAFEPDLVIVMLGSNDGFNWTGSAPTFEEEYRKLINSYLDAGADRVVLMTSPPTLEKNAFNLPNDVINAEVCPRQRAMAEEFELPLVDLREAFEAREDLQTLFRSGDGVHFSIEGAKFVAGLVADAVKKI